jgi:hypothetical protein
MTIREKTERYLVNLALTYEEVGAGAWLVHDEEKGLENVVVMVSEPLVLIRVKVMELPEGGREEFYEELLRLNAADLLHGAYALEGSNVILVDTLEGETMDLEEFQASLDSIGLALVQHYKVLSRYRVRS